MSQEQKQGRTPEVDQLRATIHELSHELTLRIERSEKRRKAWLIGGVALAVISTISLSLFTRMSFQLDAHALSQIGRGQVEQSLPRGRESLKTYLQANAPAFTSSLIASLLEALPALRPVVLHELDKKMGSLTEEFENELLRQMREGLKASKTKVESELGDATDIQKLEKLVALTAQDFNQNVDVLLQHLYPKYSAEMKRVRDHLVDLREKDESLLTEKEKREKEIIVTLLRLIVRENVTIK